MDFANIDPFADSSWRAHAVCRRVRLRVRTRSYGYIHICLPYSSQLKPQHVFQIIIQYQYHTPLIIAPYYHLCNYMIDFDRYDVSIVL